MIVALFLEPALHARRLYLSHPGRRAGSNRHCLGVLIELLVTSGKV
jgi:hypothetical protein